MVSTYYLVKLFQNASDERIKNLNGNGESFNGTTANCDINKCRVCLKVGTIPIYNEKAASDIPTAISTLADIEISENDEFPKYLCESCHGLLQGAIRFRETARKSNEVLKKIKVEGESKPEYCIHQENIPDTKKIKHSPLILQRYFTAVDIDSEDSNDKTQTKKIISKVQCQICSKIITKAYYKEHFALHDPTVSNYVCDVCGKSFRQRCSYRNHYFTHSTDFPYKCKMCPYRGCNSGLLKIHMRTHSGDYRYMCTECPARFLTKSNLNKHSLKHKDPTFKCDMCKRAFHSKLILERHFEADHLGIKNHICNICGKAFGYRKAMMRHQIDVHKREKKLNGRTPSYIVAELRNHDNSPDSVVHPTKLNLSYSTELGTM